MNKKEKLINKWNTELILMNIWLAMTMMLFSITWRTLFPETDLILIAGTIAGFGLVMFRRYNLHKIEKELDNYDTRKS